QAQIAKLLVTEDQIQGVETTLDVQFLASAVIVTTGTFLRGLMHVGNNQQPGGRAGDAAAMGLSASLKAIGLELGRLKTGTPPRVVKRSIDFSRTEVQRGDDPVPYFTYWSEDLFHVEHPRQPEHGSGQSAPKYPSGSILERVGGQLPCYITYTTNTTAQIIR